MTDVTTIDDLLPLLDGVTTCKEFGAVVIASVPQSPRGLRQRLALEARDRLGFTWTDRYLRDWLAPGCHLDARAKAHRLASREWQAENRERKRGTDAKWQAENRERRRETDAKWYEKNAERRRETSRKWKAENRERSREASRRWYEENAEHKREINAKWRAGNPGYNNAYHNQRRAEDPVFGLVHRVRARIHSALNAAVGSPGKAGRTLELLGCSADEYRLYLEGQFEDGMGWDNRHLWHVDHIRPLSSWDLSDPQQQREAFHFSNTKPVWAEENLSKGSEHGGRRWTHADHGRPA